MLFLFTTIAGILLILASIVLFVFSKPNKYVKLKPPFSVLVNQSIIFCFGIFLLIFCKLFFYAEYGKNYYLVNPFGTESAVINSRGYCWRGFSRIVAFSKYIDIKTVNKIDDKFVEPTEELEGIISNGISTRFIDQVTGKTYLSVRFETTSDEQGFIQMVRKFRTQSNLVDNTLIPTVLEQVKNTGYMFAAQDYISGSAQSFKQTLEEQLKGGSYVVVKEEKRDTVFSDIMDPASRRIKEINTTYKVNKVIDPNTGLPKRIQHEITENNISVSQVIISDVDMEEKFKDRLAAQRDESAKRQLAQQKTATAKEEQQRILAEGENEKAKERVVQEKNQITEIIQQETAKKIEEQKLEKAKIELQTAEVDAKAIRLKADAESYKNQKLVVAGLTPEMKAEYEYKKEVAKWDAVSKIVLPSTYISGSGAGNSNLGIIESLIGANLIKNTAK